MTIFLFWTSFQKKKKYRAERERERDVIPRIFVIPFLFYSLCWFFCGLNKCSGYLVFRSVSHYFIFICTLINAVSSIRQHRFLLQNYEENDNWILFAMKRGEEFEMLLSFLDHIVVVRFLLVFVPVCVCSFFIREFISFNLIICRARNLGIVIVSN